MFPFATSVTMFWTSKSNVHPTMLAYENMYNVREGKDA
jgi:hypothetical protein